MAEAGEVSPEEAGEANMAEAGEVSPEEAGEANMAEAGEVRPEEAGEAMAEAMEATAEDVQAGT